MADLCDNCLYVTGPLFDVEVFILTHLDVEDPDGAAWLDLDSIIPYPERFRRLDEIAERWEAEHKDDPTTDLAQQPEDGFNQGGCEWCESNWGTKWNTFAYEAGSFTAQLDDPERGYMHLCFTTAWTPISKRIMLVLSRLYPECIFELRYAESEHRGRIRTRRGRVLVETRYRRRWGDGAMGLPWDLLPKRRRKK